MNSASNMIAKWYQNALSASPPNTWCSTSDMPNASVGAPPVRETIDSSPTLGGGLVDLRRGDRRAGQARGR